VRARGVYGRHFPEMRVIPPGLDFSAMRISYGEDPWAALLPAASAAASAAPTAPPSPAPSPAEPPVEPPPLEMDGGAAAAEAADAPPSRQRDRAPGVDAAAAAAHKAGAEGAAAARQLGAEGALRSHTIAITPNASPRVSEASGPAAPPSAPATPARAALAAPGRPASSDFGGGMHHGVGHSVSYTSLLAAEGGGGGAPGGGGGGGGGTVARRPSQLATITGPELAAALYGSEEPPIWQEIGRFLRNPRKPSILAIARPDAKKNVGALIRAYGRSPVLRELANLVLILGNRDVIDSMASGARGRPAPARSLSSLPLLRSVPPAADSN